MKPPTDRAQHLLERFKATQGMPGADKSRLLGVVQERVARGDLPRFDVLAGPVSVPHVGPLERVWSSSWGKLGLALAVAGPAALGISQLGGPEPAPAWTPPAVARPAPLPASAPAPLPPTIDAVPAVKALEARAIQNGAARPRASGTGTTISTIDEEMRIMNAAQGALQGGQPQRALELLNDHAERFPNGKLSSARSVTRLMALCQAGNREQARREADRFLARHPQSPFVDRVKAICR